MAVNPIDEREGRDERRPIPRSGQIRRCSVRHVSIVATDPPTVQVDCLLGGADRPLPLGTMDEARPICNACTARSVWRDDED
jgi:hypothetical protein